MKILLIETSSTDNPNGVVVHVRNSIVLNQYLSRNNDCRLVYKESEILDINEQFDIIIFISATFYFKYERFLELIGNQKHCKVGWISNEIDLFANDWLKKRGFDFMIANFEEHGVKDAHRVYKDYLMANLNALQTKPRNLNIEKRYDCIQYSTYRKWREKYYQKYLIKDMILSTSSKNVKKFILAGCDCWWISSLNWEQGQETLNLFRGSLYLEDTITHKVFNHLANRFYEALYCNCAVFFDKTCINTIKKSGYFIDDYFLVDSYDELMYKVKNMKEDILEEFLDVNTALAIKDKETTLNNIENFLKDRINKD